MQTIVMASRKGGAGKTTLSCHLAVEAERQGFGPVAIVDTDEMAGLAKWWDARAADTPLLARAEPDLAAALQALKGAGMRLTIVDTPPAVSAGVAGCLGLADLVLVPVRPSPDDLRAVGVTVEMVERAGKRMVFVINQVKPRVRLTGQAAIALSQHGTVAPVMVADRIDYAACKIDGRTATELDPAGRAAEEMAALWTYVANRLGAKA